MEKRMKIINIKTIEAFYYMYFIIIHKYLISTVGS